MTLNFENLTIKDLRKLTAQFEKLEQENKILRAKYPTKIEQISAEELLGECE